MDGELEQLGERIAEQAAHLDAAIHRLLADLREFDERGGWHIQGAMSCAHWLAWRVGWDLVTARERVRVACKLAGFPMIDDALRRGEVSYSKVRAMVRVATPANEALLLEYARLMTASQLEKLSRKYALVQRHGQAPHPLDDEQRRYVRRRDTDDGMVKIEAVLHPEEAELVWTILNHAATQLARELNSPASDDSAESRAATQGRRDTVTPLLQTAAASQREAAVKSPEAAPPCDAVDGRSRRDATACRSNDSAESRQVLPAPGATATSSPEPVQPCVSDDSAESQALEVPPVSSAVDGASLPGTTLGVSDDSAESRAVPRTPDTMPASLPGHIESRTIATITAGSVATAGGSATVLHQHADAAKRAFNRADALISLAQTYLRGDRPNRSPIEITLTIPASSLHADAEDPLEVGEMGESLTRRIPSRWARWASRSFPWRPRVGSAVTPVWSRSSRTSTASRCPSDANSARLRVHSSVRCASATRHAHIRVAHIVSSWKGTIFSIGPMAVRQA